MISLPLYWPTVLITVLSLLTAVMIVLDQISIRWAFPLDRQLSRLMSTHRTKEETRIMRIASFLGGPYGIAAMSTIGVWGFSFHGSVGEALIFLIVVSASISYALMVKLLTARKRPSHGLEKQRTYAFPSAHSMASSVVYMSLGFRLASFLGDPAGPIFLGCLGLLVLGIGLSRIYLGVHYPSDVLAGFIAGGVWVWIFLFLITQV